MKELEISAARRKLVLTPALSSEEREKRTPVRSQHNRVKRTTGVR